VTVTSRGARREEKTHSHATVLSGKRAIHVDGRKRINEFLRFARKKKNDLKGGKSQRRSKLDILEGPLFCFRESRGEKGVRPLAYLGLTGGRRGEWEGTIEKKGAEEKSFPRSQNSAAGKKCRLFCNSGGKRGSIGFGSGT